MAFSRCQVCWLLIIISFGKTNQESGGVFSTEGAIAHLGDSLTLRCTLRGSFNQHSNTSLSWFRRDDGCNATGLGFCAANNRSYAVTNASFSCNNTLESFLQLTISWTNLTDDDFRCYTCTLHGETYTAQNEVCIRKTQFLPTMTPLSTFSPTPEIKDSDDEDCDNSGDDEEESGDEDCSNSGSGDEEDEESGEDCSNSGSGDEEDEEPGDEDCSDSGSGDEGDEESDDEDCSDSGSEENIFSTPMPSEPEITTVITELPSGWSTIKPSSTSTSSPDILSAVQKTADVKSSSVSTPPTSSKSSSISTVSVLSTSSSLSTVSHAILQAEAPTTPPKKYGKISTLALAFCVTALVLAAIATLLIACHCRRRRSSAASAI